MNTGPALQTRGLTKRFGALHAVRDLNLTLPAGSLCALLGPNGCGKTTALRLLLGLLRPDSGAAEVLGCPSRRLRAERFRDIGYVAESQEFPGWMTGELLFRWCRRVYPNWDRGFCARIVADFDIPLGVRLDRCSRGQRMKILLLSSIAYHPKLLLLDEPFSGLDPVHREEFGEALLGMADAGDWSLLVSSHDVDDIERLVDRAAIMGAGSIRLEGEVDDWKRRFRRIEARVSTGAATSE
ncbi:MAG: ATP-binding cassette domain-containing protein [Puniceicoccaceae bacterium]